jgi:hypothetical protein
LSQTRQRVQCDGITGALRVEALHHPPLMDATKVVGHQGVP